MECTVALVQEQPLTHSQLNYHDQMVHSGPVLAQFSLVVAVAAGAPIASDQ